MTPAQREAAARLVDWLHASGVVNSEVKETIALLRELLADETVHRCPACDSSETSDRHEWMCNECGEYFEARLP